MNSQKSGAVAFRDWVVASILAAVACSCASIPKGQYGVNRIEWVGTKALDPKALEACMVTRERPRMQVMLGVSAPSCGKPPFDSSAPTLELWSWPWTAWPVYDPAIFDVERERIERWYHARGYYDAQVLGVQTFVDDRPVDPNACEGEGADCELKIVVQLREGEPTYVDRVELRSSEKLPARLLERMRRALRLRRGQRLDETDYDADKGTLENLLLAASYARAKVTGQVSIDRNRRTAYVEYRLEPGPPCVFGEVSVEGAQADVPTDVLIQAANIPEGATFDQELVDDAQRALFALNVFSSVRILRRGQGKVVDLVVSVQRGRVTQLSAGVGIMSGTMLRAGLSDPTETLPQWDVHLSGSYENRNFLGGLRRLRIEERPRLIMTGPFPTAPEGVRPGNLLSVRFEQPATFEARTKLVVPADWDFGPDPYYFLFRHDIRLKAWLERGFLRQRLLGRVAIAHDFYILAEKKEALDEAMKKDAANDAVGISSYRLPYLEQQLVVDLRDNQLRPRLGMFFSVLVQESARFGAWGSWDYVRVLPDLRAYLPLPLGIVLASRFALGALFVWDAAADLDAKSARLGPQSYRLRGGGANSNRGFLPGRLGDSRDGGTRRWEGSIELRVPLGGDFGMVVFGDVGDVSDTGVDAEGRANPPAFRFRHLNAATGFGLRYFSVLGSIRLDAGWRIPGLQTLGQPDELPGGALPSAVHLTIGEAF